MDGRTTIQVSEDLRKELRVLAAKRDISYQELLSDMISVFKELDREKTIISLPTRLVAKARTKMAGTDITSVSDYVAFILRIILSEEKQNGHIDETGIKDRLKALGYL